jgi:hypothetical protein
VAEPVSGPATSPGSEKVQIPRVDVPARPRKPLTAAREKPASRSDVAPVNEFSVAAFTTGQWLWLEELPPRQAIMRDQVLLVQAMAQALGWGTQKPDVAQFNWPIHTNKQLDIGEEAARASLGSFVSRKLESEGCRGLVLLGAECQQRLPADFAGINHRVTTLSTMEMLRQPIVKKQVWRDLLPHAD